MEVSRGNETGKLQLNNSKSEQMTTNVKKNVASKILVERKNAV